MQGRILIVDDDESMCEMVADHLRQEGFECVWYTRAAEALAALRERELDVVLTDLNMPGMSGTELCGRIAADRPDVPVVVITAFGSLETAVAALRAGAYDFVTKPIEMELLSVVLERAIRFRALQEQVTVLSRAAEQSYGFGRLQGESPAMRHLFTQLEQIADAEIPVLINGESGTGKELVARALHEKSRRSEGPFVAVNCAALPEALVESELFGHARGAFTDARTARRGLLLEANGGTLLLDEIGDIPLTLQPKLLRALEERRVRPVGGDREVAFDVRLLAATHQDLESAVEEGRFREDLFFRVNVIKIDVPPLRARGTDVLLLAREFLEGSTARAGKQVKGISEAAARKLIDYAWPGNVRELRNAIDRAVALTPYDKIAVEDLPERIRAYRSSQLIVGGQDPNDLVPIQEVERRYILHVLRTVGGNRTVAAKILGLDRKTLYRKLQRYGTPETG